MRETLVSCDRLCLSQDAPKVRPCLGGKCRGLEVREALGILRSALSIAGRSEGSPLAQCRFEGGVRRASPVWLSKAVSRQAIVPLSSYFHFHVISFSKLFVLLHALLGSHPPASPRRRRGRPSSSRSGPTGPAAAAAAGSELSRQESFLSSRKQRAQQIMSFH